MTFTVRNAGDKVRSADIREIQDALQGVAGGANRLQITQVNDATYYALIVQNLDGTYSYGLQILDSASATIALFAKAAVTFGKKIVATLGAFTAAADMFSMTATWNAAADTFNGIKVVITNTASAATSALLSLQTATATVFHVLVGGQVFINDTANVGMTQGLTVKQGATTDQILALKSSDVDHDMTTIVGTGEDDTYGAMGKVVAGGGLLIEGYTNATNALVLGGNGVTDDTAKTTAGGAYVELRSWKRSGTSRDVAGTNANLVAMRNGTTTRFLFDAEGSAHADVEWIAFDDHDDVALLSDFQSAMLANQDPLKAGFVDFLKYDQDALEAAKIVHFDRDNPGHAMVNTTRLSMLMVGALKQLSQRNDALAAEVTALRNALPSRAS